MRIAGNLIGSAIGLISGAAMGMYLNKHLQPACSTSP